MDLLLIQLPCLLMNGAQLCLKQTLLSLKALLHQAIFLATCQLAILLRYKLHELLTSVTCSEMSRDFFIAASVAKKQTSALHAMVIATKALRHQFILGHVTLSNVSCNLRCNGAMKLRDKLLDKNCLLQQSPLISSFCGHSIKPQIDKLKLLN